MALTKTFPTGDPAGLSIVDTRRVIGSLIVCDTSGNPRLGVLPRNTSPIVTATASLNYAVTAADFVTSRTGAGAELLSNDGTTNVLTTAAPASNARTDVIWVRPLFTASADATNTPVFGVTQGVTSGTVPPPEPAIPAGALKLATVYFPSGATATNSSGVVITQAAQFTATRGGVVLFRDINEMKAWVPCRSQQGRIVGSSGIWEYDGTNWVPQFAMSGNFTTNMAISTSAVNTYNGTPVKATAESSTYINEVLTVRSGGFTAPLGGVFAITGGLTMTSSAMLQKLNVRIFIDLAVTGTSSKRLTLTTAAAEDTAYFPSATFKIPAGGTVSFGLYQASGIPVVFAFMPDITYLGPLS